MYALGAVMPLASMTCSARSSAERPISQDEAMCLPIADVLPSPIPTEQSTSDLLYEQAQASDAAYYANARRSAESLISRRVSVASLGRTGLLIDYSPPTLDESLPKASTIIAGRVVDQYLGRVDSRRTGVSVVSRIEPANGGPLVDVAQAADFVCGRNDEPMLGYIDPLLEQDKNYAMLVRIDGGSPRVLLDQAYLLEPDGSLTPLRPIGDVPSQVGSLAELQRRFTAARG